jgi:hypothetical protein
LQIQPLVSIRSLNKNKISGEVWEVQIVISINARNFRFMNIVENIVLTLTALMIEMFLSLALIM